MKLYHKTMLTYKAYALAGAILAMACFCMSSCRSPYPACGEAATYRCAGSMVEMCDGQNWNPRWDCGEIYFDGDNHVIYQCVEREAKATCEVIK